MPNLYDTMRTWAEIDLDALEYNFDAVRAHLPQDMKLLAAVKSDAYGHGAVRIAQLLEGKADFFAVAMMDEAAELRLAGIETPILILGLVQPSDYARAVKYDAAVPVSSLEEARAISACAQALGEQVRVHIAADTGMSRIGFPCTEQSADEIAEVAKLPGVLLEGIFSHFALADAHDKSYTEYQLKNFEMLNEMLEQRGVQIAIRHIFNSAAIVDMEPRFDMVREGIILYGLHPSQEVDLSNIGGIRAVMSMRSHVTLVKTLPAGVAVSYGCTYKTQRETVIATVSAGYADGVPRFLSNCGKVLIRGEYAPIVGRVCMDQFMVDVTDISGVRAGDVATIFGTDGEKTITADEVAESIGTIGYELVCGINNRVPRVYIRNGEIESVKRVLPGE